MKIVITFCEDICALLKDSKDFKKEVKIEPAFNKLDAYERDFLNKFVEQMDYQKANFLGLDGSRFELMGESDFLYDEATITLYLEVKEIIFRADSGFYIDNNKNLCTFQITARLEGEEEEISSLKSSEIYNELMISMMPQIDKITEKIKKYIEEFGF